MHIGAVLFVILAHSFVSKIISYVSAVLDKLFQKVMAQVGICRGDENLERDRTNMRTLLISHKIASSQNCVC